MVSKVLRASLAAVVGVLVTTSAASAQESALARARDRAKGAPMDPESSLAYGRALRRAGQEEAALVELRRGLAVAGTRHDAATRLAWEMARAHIARRDFGQAMSACRGMAKRPGGVPASRVCAADAHLLWRRATEARSELAEVAKAPRASAEVRYEAKIVEGRARELEVKEAEAEAAYRAAVEIAPERAEGHARLGALLHRLGKDGLPELRRATELDPTDPFAQLALGRALPAASAEALAAFERAVAERPTYVDAWRGLAEGYALAKRLSDAKRAAAAVLEIAPNDVLSHVVAGRVALAEGRADDALRSGETASKLMPNSAAARLLVADAFAKKGEIDLAIEAYQAALGLDRTDPTTLVHAADACVAAGRFTTARAFARRATADFPDHAPGWVALGDALAADKDPAGARSAYETAKRTRGADVPRIEEKLARLR